MKKAILCMTVFLLAKICFGQDSTAQTNTAPSPASTTKNTGVRFGLTASPQISWMSAGDNKLDGNGAYVGYAYGLMLDALIPSNYAFATGIIISAEGGKLIYNDSTKFNYYGDSLLRPATEVDYRTQYVQIPLTMKLRTNQVGYMTYFGQFGLQAGVKIRSRADFVGGESKIDFSDDVTLPDLGLLLGAGIEYQIVGNTAIHVSLQYYNGFIDVTDNPEGYKTKSAQNHLRLQLGVYF